MVRWSNSIPRMPSHFFLPASDPLAPVLLAFEHRFVTAAHVQRAFKLKRRTAQHRLAQLVGLRLLATVPVYQTLSSFPNVYVATRRGVSRLAQAFEKVTGQAWTFGGAEQRRRGRPRRLTFIEHELDVTSCDIAVENVTGTSPDVELLHVERRYDRRGRGLSFRDEHGERHRIVPDAGYYVRHTSPERRWLDLCMLEMDRGQMAWGTRMVEKFAAYEAWAESNSGRRYLLNRQQLLGDPNSHAGTFRLLVVARSRAGEGSDQDRLVKLAMAALPLSHAMRRRLWLTTWGELVREPQGARASTWWWGKDFAAWRDTYLELDRAMPHDLSGDRRRRALVAEHFAQQPRRLLFRQPSERAWYTERPHEREHYGPDNSILLPSWDREGIGTYAGV
jgi:hypothetical protein